MKKTILKKIRKKVLLLALLLTGFGFTFANTTEGINKKTLDAFQKQFADARNVDWKVREDYVRASFVLDSTTMTAYYAKDGELLALSRNILVDQLPLAQVISLKEKYKDYWVDEMVEIRLHDETQYYVSIENSQTKLVLQSDGGYGWTLFSKERKNHR